MATTYTSKTMDTKFGSDFETSTENTNYFDKNQDTRVILWCLQNFETMEVEMGTDIDSYFNALFKKQQTLEIYFHNLNWDGDFILKWLDKNPKFKEYSFVDEVSGAKKSHFGYSKFTSGSTIYAITVWYRDSKKVTRQIFFRCSYKILSAGIDALGKGLGLNKHQLDPNELIEFDGKKRNFYDFEPQSKLEDFYNLPRGKEFVEYCARDVEIQVKSMLTFIDTINNLSVIKNENRRRATNRAIYEQEMKTKGKSNIHVQKDFNPLAGNLTAASVTAKVAKFYTKEWIENEGLNIGKKKQDRVSVNTYWKIKKPVYDFARPFYKGGFSQINTDYLKDVKDIKHGLMIDITSAYPYQMVAHPMPYGSLLDERPEGIENVDYYKFLTVHIKSAKIKPQYRTCPCLLNWNKPFDHTIDRYVKEIKNATAYYLSFEWEMLNKFYDIKVSWVDEKYMLCSNWLRDASKGFYDVKEHYAHLKDTARKNGAKILVNALYGKHGQNDNFDSFGVLSVEEMQELGLMDENGTILKNKDIEIFTEDGKSKKFKFKGESSTLQIGEDNHYVRFEPLKDIDDDKLCPNVATAAVITAWERTYLLTTLDRIGFDKFLVSDTDSIAVGNLSMKDYYFIKKKLSQEVMIEGSELGMWDLEFDGNLFKFFGTYGAKKYGIWDKDNVEMKFRCAGFKRSKGHTIAKPSELYDIDARMTFDFHKDVNIIENATMVYNRWPSGLTLRPVTKQLNPTGN